MDLELLTLATPVNPVDQLAVVVDMEELLVELVIFHQYHHHKEMMEEDVMMRLPKELEVLVVVVHQLLEQIALLGQAAAGQVLQYLGCQVLEFIHCYRDQYKLH